MFWAFRMALLLLSASILTQTNVGVLSFQLQVFATMSACKNLLDHLGVKSVAAVIGGSMGGMAVLDWPLSTAPGFVRNIVAIATSARHSAWGISWGEAQRQSIYSDPKHNDGYYTCEDPPSTGLAAARMAALLTYYITRGSFSSRFGRKNRALEKMSTSHREQQQREHWQLTTTA